MKIGIIGPSKLRDEDYVLKVAEIVAESGHEVVLTPDKGSSSEFFANNYLDNNGKKIYSVIPQEDKEFGFSWINTKLGENINCGTWRNQPEKLNEETSALICIGYAAGVLAEIAYSKWFNKKPIYIIKELVSCELPKEVKLDIHYISINELGNILK